MTAYTVTVNTNSDSLTTKTGGDTYAVNGATLTIDQDSRYGLNQSTSTSLAAITISATLGGKVLIDARKVRYIAFTGGSGTVPAANTVISQGGASGKLICVQASLTTAPLASAASMPATGFIKIKQWNDVAYSAAALTGITATGSVDVSGCIELVGDEAATVTVPRLGTFEMLGEWYQLGTSNATANQQFQIPSNASLVYAPGIFVETAVASGLYEFYPNAGAATTVATDIRAKVCWITTAGLVRLGHNGTSNAGFVPVTGLNVRIPNIICQNCTTAARTANVLPNATLATRYDFTTTSGGVVNINKALLNWYPSFAQAFSVTLENIGVAEQIGVSEIAQPMTWSQVGVGQSAAQSQFALLMSLNFAGGTFTRCHWSRATLAASGNYVVSLTDISGFSFVDERTTALAIRANATTGSHTATRAVGCSWIAPKMSTGRMALITCKNITVTNASYCDVVTGTTATTAVQNAYAFDVASNCDGVTISGLDFFGLTNVHPYLGALNVASAGCSNIKLRDIGTSPSGQLSLGSANQSAYLVVLATGAAANTVKIQRCFVSATRTGLFTGDNSSKNIIFENVMGDYADAPVTPMLNAQHKSIGATHAMTAQTACYGTHFFSAFVSATVGRIGILANETTTETAAQVGLSGGAAFTSAGGLYMPVIGHQAVFEMPFRALGHTSFQNAAAVMAGGTIGNYTLTFDADVGDGFLNVYTALTGANLAALVVNPAVGVSLRIKIVTAVNNATAITSLYVLTNSTAIAQANYYPLDTNTVTFTGISSGSDVVVLAAGTTTILAQADAITGSSYAFQYSGAQTVDVRIYKNTLVPFFINSLSLTTTDASIPVSQTADRNFS